MTRYKAVLRQGKGWFVVDQRGILPNIPTGVMPVATMISRNMNREEKRFCLILPIVSTVFTGI